MKTCTFCNDPANCTLCLQLNGPARLTSKDLGLFARDLWSNRKVAEITNVSALRAAIAAERKINISLKARLASMPAPRDAVTQLHVVTFDSSTAPTVPPAPVRVLAPAPMPTPPPQVHVAHVPVQLAVGDWAALGREVESGRMTETEGERVGAQWLALMTPQAFA